MTKKQLQEKLRKAEIVEYAYKRELVEARRKLWAMERKVRRLLDKYSKARMDVHEIVFGTNFRDGKDNLSK